MESLTRRYRYSYRLDWRFGHWRHSYALIGRFGAVEFHVTDFGENNPHGSERYSAGLEFHYRQPPDYMDDQPPSHDECWLLKQPCWHDGTSLYAQERLLQFFDGIDHETMFRVLANHADEQFATKVEG